MISYFYLHKTTIQLCQHIPGGEAFLHWPATGTGEEKPSKQLFQLQLVHLLQVKEDSITVDTVEVYDAPNDSGCPTNTV